jgi:uncharacterized membrane protein
MVAGRLKYYIDLIVVVILTGLCILFVLVEPFNDTPLRIPFSLIILLFLPGYALIAAMFPWDRAVHAQHRSEYCDHGL